MRETAAVITDFLPQNESPEANLGSRVAFGYEHLRNIQYPHLSFRWGLYQHTTYSPVAYGQMDFSLLASRFSELIKLERQHRERLAGVRLDPIAQRLLIALDQKTSIRWEDISDTAECDWSEAARAAAVLVGANLCEVSPTRIRLSEYGDKLLAESSRPEAKQEVAS